MKFNGKDSRDLILRKAIFLRYGKTVASHSERDRPLLSWAAVSAVLKVPLHVLTAARQQFDRSRQKFSRDE